MNRTARRIRPAAVAGAFYPARPDVLAAVVDECLGASRPNLHATDRGPKALVVPHAGYVYSGPVAGTAYAALGSSARTVERVVLLGPAHFVALDGFATTSADAWDTPFGLVPIDADLRDAAIAAGARVDDRAHADEHSLEVQLPFLLRTLQNFTLLPLVAGRASVAQVVAVLDAVWGGPETLVVVSTDLSHYLDSETAHRRDRRTADSVLAADIDGIAGDDACGAYGLRGLLAEARTRELTVELLDLRNSGDIAGPRDRVVGYGAFALRAP